MKRISSFLMGISTALFLSSCGTPLTTNDVVPKESATGEDWTIMVYMSGGSNEHLHGSASAALEEMTKVKYPENINVVIETGGSYSWKADGIDTNYLDRFEAQHGSLRLVERTESVNMALTSTLSDFIEWSTDNYQSDHYALIVYGNGANSAYGVAHDEPYLNESLNLQRISTAIDNVGVEFDIIGFDADLMASIENAAILSDNTEFLVASQETMAPGGWNYTDWLNYIIDNPTVRVEDIAKAACDTYINKCSKNNCETMATMSVVRLSKITGLTQAINGMAGEMRETLKSLKSASALLANISDTMNFGAKSADEGYSNMADLGNLAQRVNLKTSERVRDELNNAVIYNVCGKYRNEACGLSIFYPYNQSSDELPRYMEISPMKHYKEFLADICAHGDTGLQIPNTHENTTAFADYSIEKDRVQYSTISGTTGLELNMMGNMDIVKSVRQRIYKKSENGFLYLGDTKDVDSNKEAGIFKTKNEFTAIQLNGNYIQTQAVYSGNGYTIYTSPIKIENDQKNLRFVAEHKDNGTSKYKILGLYDSLGPGSQSSRYITPIRIYNHITPLFRDFDQNKLTNGELFKTWPLGARISEKYLKEGTYRSDFSVSYIYGDSFLSGSADFGYADGTITYN